MPISYKSSPPLMFGCLKLGVNVLTSKSPKSLKNLET